MSEKRATRAGLIGRRWRGVAATALLTFVLTFFLARLQRDALGRISELPEWSLWVAMVAPVALLLRLSLRRFVAVLGVHHPLAYPPYWFGIAIGVVSALALISSDDRFAQAMNLAADDRNILGNASIALALAPAGVLLLASLRWLFVSRPDLRPTDWETASGTAKPTLEWIKDDEPIRGRDGDLFGHATIAQRIGRRLASEEPSAQAVVGRLGSGKSTIRELVQRWLVDHRTSRPVEVIQIELWPFESPRAAVEGILTAVVEALSREVTTSQLDGVPAAYGEAIAKVSGVGDWLPKVLRKPTTPAASLRALDDVATAIGRKYVLWVEDLERFAAGDPNAPAQDSELERLAPIRALLHGLDQTRSITVVTATTDLLRRFDLEKIARYVERIPLVEISRSRTMISTIRDQLIGGATVIDPAAPAARRRLGWEDRDNLADAIRIAWLGDTIGNFASAIAALARTPRILKQGLRRAHETWSALRGEIDLDEVIALSILREAQPDAFALLDRHVVALRARRSSRHGEPSAMQKFMQAVAELSVDTMTLRAIEVLVDELFGTEARRRPQGVSQDNHTDYWLRFLSMPSLTDAERDQPVLQILRRGDDERVVDLLLDAKRSPAAEDFASLLPLERVDSLISTLVPRLLNQDVSGWEEARPPGLVPLWRMIKARTRTPKQLEALLVGIEDALATAAPRNLLLTYEIAHWFATSVPEVADVFPASSRERINERVRALFIETYQDRPTELAARLRGAPAPLLLWLTWSLERIRAGRARGVPFAQWPVFSKTLLDALVLEPQVMSLQIAVLVTRQQRRLLGPDVWEFDSEQCLALFGDVDTFVDLLRRAVGTMAVDARVQAVLDRRVAADEDDEEDEDTEATPGAVDRGAGASESVDDDGRDELSDEERATRMLVAESGDVERTDGSLPGQVEGYWYDRLEAIPATRPDTLPSAVLPEKPELNPSSYGLFLIEHGGEWAPLSAEGESSNAEAISRGEPRFFVTARDWKAVYAVTAHAPIRQSEVRDRFGEAAGRRAREDALTVMVLFTRVVDVVADGDETRIGTP